MKDRFRTLRMKIVLMILGFSVIIALIVAALSFFISRRYLLESQRQSAYINLQLLGNEMGADLNSVYAFTNSLQFNPDVENYLSHADNYSTSSDVNFRKFSLDTWERLSDDYRTSTAYEQITRFVVSNPDGSNFLHIVRSQNSSEMNISGKILSATFFDRLMASDGYGTVGLVNSPLSPMGNTFIMPILRPVKSSNSSRTLGWIYVEVSSELFTQHLRNLDIPEDAELFLSFGDTASYKYENGKLIASDIPADAITYTLSSSDISLSLLPSQSELRSRTRYYVLVIMLVLLFIIFTGIIMSELLRRWINAPVSALLSKLSKVGAGDFSRDPNIEWNNELGEIGHGINSLSENVDALIKTKLADEHTKQTLEYQVLQSQVNPHFMYNTLNTIKWMATIQGAEGIADMSTALSRLLKNISKSKDSLITLESEISLLGDYFTIMKYRYGGTIELEYEIDDYALLSCLINRFSLQPIVENAIFHGIEPKGSAGRISIHIYKEDTLLHIDVTDNGVGMDEATLQGLLENEASSSNDFFKQVGVSNVNKRIKFAFGEEYGITAESAQGEYTIMHYTLPAVTDTADIENGLGLESTTDGND